MGRVIVFITHSYIKLKIRLCHQIQAVVEPPRPFRVSVWEAVPIVNPPSYLVDITYIRLQKGWLYLVAVIDWFSRYVLAW